MLFDMSYLSFDFVISYEMLYFLLVSWTRAELKIFQSANVCSSLIHLLQQQDFYYSSRGKVVGLIQNKQKVLGYQKEDLSTQLSSNALRKSTLVFWLIRDHQRESCCCCFSEPLWILLLSLRLPCMAADELVHIHNWCLQKNLLQKKYC